MHDINKFQHFFVTIWFITVSDREVGWCLEPEGNGVNPGGRNGGGPGPPSGKQDEQLTASRGDSLMEQAEDGKKG
jgi:hypothetical protein